MTGAIPRIRGGDPTAIARELIKGETPDDAVSILLDFISESFGRRSAVDFWAEHVHCITALQAAVLDALWSTYPHPASKDRIYDRAYAGRYDDTPDIKIIDVSVYKVRKKLPAGAEIQTIWGHGYRLVLTDPPEGWPVK